MRGTLAMLGRRIFWALVLRGERARLGMLTTDQRFKAAQAAVHAFRAGGGWLKLKNPRFISYRDPPAEDAVTVIALLRSEVTEILRAEVGPRC